MIVHELTGKDSSVMSCESKVYLEPNFNKALIMVFLDLINKAC